MSACVHIVCMQNKDTHGENMSDIFMSNLWIIMPTLWACFIVYATWYSTRAKHYAPITPMEARQLWVIHRQGTDCTFKKWRQIKHNCQTVGFECGCGYRHVQRRPITARMPPASDRSRTPSFNTAQSISRTSQK